MIEFTQNDKFISEKTIGSLSITYPRTVRLLFGNYTKQHILHNLKLKIIYLKKLLTILMYVGE